MSKTKKRGRRDKSGLWMSQNEGMLYTDVTWPVVQGCTKVSTGCARCMAEQSLGHCRGWKKNGTKPFVVQLRWDLLSMPMRGRKPRRILVAPQGDMFHEEVPYEFFRKVLIIISITPQHTYFFLTKRPERMKEYLELAALEGLWPLPNANIGVSAENQEWYDKRMPVLISIPVHDLSYRWVACEPLLGPITLGVYGHNIGWLVYGQERANYRRPMKREWGDALVKECGELCIPFYRHRSEKLWKLNTVTQQRRKQEDAMKIELLNQVPSDTTPSLVLDRSLLESVKGLRINGVAIVFTKPGELGDQPVAVSINAPAKAMSNSAFEEPGSVSEPKPCKTKGGKKEKRTTNVRDIEHIFMEDYQSKEEMATEVGITSKTLTMIMEHRPVTEITKGKLELFLTKHYGEPCVYETKIRSYQR